MGNIFIVLAFFVALCQILPAHAGRGTVCVAGRAATPFRGQVIPPTGEVSSHGLRVKIDKHPAVPWPQRQSLKIEELDLNERHLLAIIDSSGRSVESVWFRFSAYKSTDLCMEYDGYKAWACKKRRDTRLGVNANEITGETRRLHSRSWSKSVIAM